MKKRILNWTLALTVSLFVFTSCSDDDTPTPADNYANYTCLIVNQGNFTEKNSSISYYREGDNTVVDGAFFMANGRKLAASVESATIHDTIALIICNTPDKIEVIDVRTAKTYTAPIQGDDVVSPRYAAINSTHAYVTCWGGEPIVLEDGSWVFPNSYILKIDLKTKEIVDKIKCGTDAESILLIGQKMYVAVRGGINIFDISNNAKVGTIVNKTFNGSAKQMSIDNNNKMWYTVAGSGIACANLSTLTVEHEIEDASIGGHFCLNKTKDKVYYYSMPMDENWNPISAKVYTIDVNTKAKSEKPVFEGSYFYGLGANPKSGLFYTAEIYNFTANSKVQTFNAEGKLGKEFNAGVGACRFVFFN